MYTSETAGGREHRAHFRFQLRKRVRINASGFICVDTLIDVSVEEVPLNSLRSLKVVTSSTLI
jgi:hypothetical protein